VLRGRTVLVGVSGGIAAYKTCELVRWLRRREAAVVVVMTPAAERFVTPLTFEALSGNPVITSLWGEQKHDLVLPEEARRKTTGKVGHIDLAEAADVMVLAPATADLIARLVHGEAPDALTTIVLASRARLVVAPSMDFGMWRHAATQENVRVLRRRGAVIVGPASGELASGLMGPGRLADVEEIGAAVEQAAARRASLAGVRVLIGAGRTEEPLDPVRVLTNRSSGRMGFALAEAARDRGAGVTLVAGPASIEPPLGVALANVRTATEMERAMRRAVADTDVVLMAAAVADYRPRRAAREKLKRGKAPLTLALEPNPDILAGLAATRRPGQVFVGFALETSRGLARARAKLAAKGLDLVALNAPAQGIGRETSVVTLVEARTARRLPEQSKREIAEAILDRVLELRAARQKAAAKPGRVATKPGQTGAQPKRSGKAR
jgi:phosphopantothenoylcysteine decarboxylase/phosphopantothenate--cysteine ligase